MKKRVGFLLVISSFGMLLAGCSKTGERIKSSVKKHWDHGISLLEKGAEKIGLDK